MKVIKIPGISQPVALDAPICLQSPHFSWYEATKGGSRIPESEEITGSIIRIAKALEGVRDEFGGQSITIASWYRPPAINRAVGGARFSKHIEGHAVDILIDGLDPRAVTAALSKYWLGGVGDSSAFTHLDLGERRRWDYGG
jgi:Peptidase M15